MQAMEEAGIPIDMVGGTSIGSFTGALYCEEGKTEGVQARAFGWCRDMGTLWPKITDLTYPFTAMFTGRAENRRAERKIAGCEPNPLFPPLPPKAPEDLAA